MKPALKISWVRAAAVLLALFSFQTATAEEPNYTSMVRGKPVFPIPLNWSSAQAPLSADSEGLWNALAAFDSGVHIGIASIEQFLAAHPISVWNPSLHANLAEF